MLAWRVLFTRPLQAGAVVCLLALLAGCGQERRAARQAVPGDVETGRRLVFMHGCGSCHVIPGVRGADRMIGPSLRGVGGRMYIAGRLPNEPANLHRWIMDPQGINPGSAMPNLNVTTEQAWHIAAFLYTLEERRAVARIP